MPDFTLKSVEEAAMKAAVSALNKMAKRLITVMSRRLREKYDIKKRDLDANFSIQKATAKNPIAVLFVYGERISLSAFNPKKTKIGVQVTIVRGKPVMIKGVFVGRRKVGSLGSIGSKDVFERKGKERLPIKSVAGPNIADLVRSKEITELITTTFNMDYEKLFQSEFKYYSSKV
ncbi:MAG: phage tail protein [Bacteroidetes bacterium]|nr:phage tail protein [Bacteroidota bacterium]